MSQTRQLAAIMFTDIVGYTALMGDNEQKAFELLNKNRQIQKPIIEEFNGRLIKELGDGILASFNTVSDAVNAAVKIQESWNKTKEFSLRIGIHQGEVVFEADDIFGDAVNIASRIQTLGVPGSILFSKKVNDEIKNKSEFQTVSLGSFDFKNVKEPLEVFALANKGLIVPKRKKMEGKLKKKNVQRRNIIVALSFIIIVVAAFFIYKNFSAKNDKAEVIDKSIAVLPFVNMSNDKNQEYFSDGLSEELLNLLSKTSELKVIGRTSSFSFKGKNEDLRIIAEKLGVAHILEGSVRKDGNKIRVTAQLIRATDGSHLWSEAYDRDLEGIFKLQDEIAFEIVKQLKLKLIPVRASIAAPINTESYNLLLQGNFFAAKRDSVNVAKAVEFYRQALAIDSSNARVWAVLADGLMIQATWKWIDTNEGYEKVRKAATKAIDLNGNSAEAHKVLGDMKLNYDWDWEGAETEFRKALTSEPQNPDVLRSMGALARTLGRLDESLRLIKQSIALDPVKSITYLHLGFQQIYANHLEDAILTYKKILELNPQFPMAHTNLGEVYLLQGKPDKALTEIQQELSKRGKGFGLAMAYRALQRQKEAEEALRDYIAEFQGTSMYMIAEIYAFFGDKNKAFEWLEKAYTGRDVRLTWLKGDPLLKNLEGDPRHEAFMKKMNLPLD